MNAVAIFFMISNCFYALDKWNKGHLKNSIVHFSLMLGMASIIDVQ